MGKRKQRGQTRAVGQVRTQIVLRENDKKNADELAQLFGIATLGDVVRLGANTLAGKIANGDAPGAEAIGYRQDDSPAFQTTVWLRPQDRRAVDAVQDHYGLESMAAAVRFSIAWLGWFLRQSNCFPPRD